SEQSGILAGDIISKVNGKPMKGAADVRNTVGLLRVGATITIDILRDGKPQTITLTTIDPDKRRKDYEASNRFLFGAVMRDFDQLMPDQGRIKGVLLLQVERDSSAWSAGLRRGDVIVTANKIKVSTIDQLQDVAKH